MKNENAPHHQPSIAYVSCKTFITTEEVMHLDSLGINHIIFIGEDDCQNNKNHLLPDYGKWNPMSFSLKEIINPDLPV